ncbi:FAD-dependent monooxygenase [Streptomyces sp. NPDC057644]|uniref:FAD-dependent monooxygenase n=1 Tax=Streptomyces sp. NPDC057644 TaxID=3346191 RepID=UPI0036875D08
MTPPGPAAAAHVLVVGAGPVGLLLAGDLRRHGVRVSLADRLAAPMTESRASQLNARTMEILGSRGLLEEFGDLTHEPLGHFGGQSFRAEGGDSRYPGNWKTPQFRTEAVLGRWAAALGVELHREHELHALTVTDEGVAARFRTPDGPRTLHAAYVVGCDGADSTVRRLAGIGLDVTAPARELLRADIAGVDVPAYRFERFPGGFATSARRPDGVTRVMVHATGRLPGGRTGPPSFEEIATVWEEVTGHRIAGATASWTDAFDDGSAQATRYRRGRVLLAGDAAHTHMPVGGQALNLGLQDAANLGWKLAAQVHGWAPPGLLDSYHAERHPAGRRVIANVSAQGLLLFGGEGAEPVRRVLAGLLAEPGPRALVDAMISGLDVRYDVGAGDAPLLGARLPDIDLTVNGEPTTAARLLAGGRGVLLSLSPHGHDDPAAPAAEPARGRDDRLRVVEAEGPADLEGATALLVRPDGHVVWTDRAQTSLHHALDRWFGTAAAASRV